MPREPPVINAVRPCSLRSIFGLWKVGFEAEVTPAGRAILLYPLGNAAGRPPTRSTVTVPVRYWACPDMVSGQITRTSRKKGATNEQAYVHPDRRGFRGYDLWRCGANPGGEGCPEG